jgi:hypothetical protein
LTIFRNISITALIVGLGLMILLSLGCSDSMTGPGDSEFYPIEIDDGDLLIYEGPSDSLTITGPARVYWYWVRGILFMAHGVDIVRVRPLRPFPSEPMTPEMIALAQARYTDVPFIEELLAGIPDPSDEEWATAYVAWLDTMSAFERQIMIDYRDDPRPDRTLVAQDLLDQINQHELVVPGSAELADPPVPEDPTRFIWLVYKGVPPHDNGTPDMQVIILTMYYQDPSPPATTISREDALWLHDFIDLLYEANVLPMLIDLSTGVRAITLWDDVSGQ